MRRKSFIYILFFCITMLFTACGEESVNLIEIDGNTYDLTEKFEDVIEDMSDDDVLVCDMIQGYAYDKDGTFSHKISNDDKETMPLCMTKRWLNEGIYNKDMPGIIVNVYMFLNDFKSVNGITEKSSESKVKRLEGFQIRSGGYHYCALYMDNKMINQDDYKDEINKMLMEELGPQEEYTSSYYTYERDFMFFKCVEQKAIEKLKKGKIDSYSIISYDTSSDKNSVYYYIYTYDESLENQ